MLAVLLDVNYSSAQAYGSCSKAGCTSQSLLLPCSRRNHGSPWMRCYCPCHLHGGTQGHGDHPIHTSRTPKSSCTPEAFVDSYRYVFWHQPRPRIGFCQT